MLNAEKAFAAFTEAHTIKEGFLAFMDSTGVIFRQGQAVNARETYLLQKAGPAILSWKPDFAVISSAGDMGVTSGPYELRPKALQDTPIGKGTFSSIWCSNQKGEWKNLADLGVGYGVDQSAKTISVEKTVTGEKMNANAYKEVWLLDEKLNEAIAVNDRKTILHYIATNGRLLIEDHLPFDGIDAIASSLPFFPVQMRLKTENGGFAASGDFVYLYGSIDHEQKKGAYLRAWVFHKNEWKVILQTIKW